MNVLLIGQWRGTISTDDGCCVELSHAASRMLGNVSTVDRSENEHATLKFNVLGCNGGVGSCDQEP